MGFESEASRRPEVTGKRYESMFCLFLVALVFLWRENSHLVYPHILYLVLALLGLNLAAGLSLKAWPSRSWVSAILTMMNCAVIMGILEYSGGERSNLWVLFLLPIYTACMLLGRGELFWVTFGAVSFNTAFVMSTDAEWDQALFFSIAVKNAIMIFAAMTTYALVSRERVSERRLREQRSMLDRLERSSGDLERRLGQSQAMAQLGMASSGVAHDLKSPLAIIGGTTEFILRRHGGAEIRRDLERIHRAVGLAHRIVAGILHYSSGSGFKTELCDLREEADRALSLYRSVLATHKVRVRTELPEGACRVEACSFELQRLFLNLLSNAKDAMAGGGEITLRVVALPSDEPGEAGWVQAVVDDTGPGIPEEKADALFKPFVTTKDPGKGTGLGLYLCREIAVRNGGTLRALNREEGGARFVLTLPAAARAEGSDVPKGSEGVRR